MEIPDYKDYENASSGDLIADPFFQSWIIDPTAEKEAFWNDFLLQVPAASGNLQVARAFLQGIAFREAFPEEERVAASFERHWEDVTAVKATSERRNVIIRRIARIAAAAVLVGVLITVAVTWLFPDNKQQLHQTAYGKTGNILLPDGSSVTLNANSTLQYTGNWNNKDVREVWLKGEAFFEIKKTGTNGTPQVPQKFRVHTAELAVEVLGTSFDIRDRRGVTEVVLASGSIELSFRNPAYGKILMKPGDRVVYDARQQKVLQDTANAADFSAWKKNRLILKTPTVREIIKYLEDNFGHRILLEDQRMGSKTINGPILYDNLDDALFILSTVLNTQIIREDSTIILRPR